MDEKVSRREFLKRLGGAAAAAAGAPSLSSFRNMGDTLEWCHYADHQCDSARGSTPGWPWAGAVSASQAQAQVDGLLRGARP